MRRNAGNGAPQRTANRAARRYRSGARMTSRRDAARVSISPFRSADGRQAGERGLDLLARVLVVLERTVEIPLVRREVEVTVTTQVEQDDLRFARLLGGERLVDGDADRMGRLGRREDPLRAGERDADLERGPLMDGLRLDVAALLEEADQRRHAVIPQAAGVDGLGDEIVAERMHLD